MMRKNLRSLQSVKSGDLLKSWDIKRQITNKELELAALV